MNRNQFESDVMHFHLLRGGFSGRAASHALRMLREATELCIACGAFPTEIGFAVGDEIGKATKRKEIGIHNTEHILEEVADTDITFTIFKNYFIDPEDEETALLRKLEVCKERLWQPDADGVLWRPGVVPAASTGTEAESS